MSALSSNVHVLVNGGLVWCPLSHFTVDGLNSFVQLAVVQVEHLLPVMRTLIKCTPHTVVWYYRILSVR